MEKVVIFLSVWWISGLILFLVLNRAILKEDKTEKCDFDLLACCLFGSILAVIVVLLAEGCEYLEKMFCWLKDHANKEISFKKKCES